MTNHHQGEEIREVLEKDGITILNQSRQGRRTRTRQTVPTSKEEEEAKKYTVKISNYP